MNEESVMQEQIATDLLNLYGPLLGGDALIKVLGYSNPQAFRQARRQNRIGVHVFSVPARQGKFALSRDVARWLASISGGERSKVAPLGSCLSQNNE